MPALSAVGNLAGHSLVAFCVLLAVSWLLAGLLMLMGARISGLKHVTLGRTVLAAVVASLVAWLCVMLFSDVVVAGTSLGLLLGLVMTWLIIKHLFDTTMGRALMIWAFDVLAHVVAGLLGITANGFRLDLSHLLR